MKYNPHDYQIYTTEYILNHPIAAVLLDMGLGKSVITLTAIFDLTLDSFLVRKVLVIAPLRVARDTWPIEWLISRSGIPFDFDMIVVDELSSFKSHQAKRFKSLLKVRPQVKRFVGLTGTPSSNGLMDLWAEYRILDMGQRLGRFIGRYREDYFVPDKRNQQMIFS